MQGLHQVAKKSTTTGSFDLRTLFLKSSSSWILKMSLRIADREKVLLLILETIFRGCEDLMNVIMAGKLLDILQSLLQLNKVVLCFPPNSCCVIHSLPPEVCRGGGVIIETNFLSRNEHSNQILTRILAFFSFLVCPFLLQPCISGSSYKRSLLINQLSLIEKIISL